MLDVETVRLLGSVVCLVLAVVTMTLGLVSGAYHLPPHDRARRRASLPPAIAALAGVVVFPWGAIG